MKNGMIWEQRVADMLNSKDLEFAEEAASQCKMKEILERQIDETRRTLEVLEKRAEGWNIRLEATKQKFLARCKEKIKKAFKKHALTFCTECKKVMPETETRLYLCGKGWVKKTIHTACPACQTRFGSQFLIKERPTSGLAKQAKNLSALHMLEEETIRTLFQQIELLPPSEP